jgi:hypothetical protein
MTDLNEKVTCQIDGKSYMRHTFQRASDGAKIVTYLVDRHNEGNWAYLPDHKSRIIISRIEKALG